MRRLWIIYWISCAGLWLGLALGAGAQPNVTGYAALTAQLRADAARSSLLRVASLGKTARGGRDLWLVRLAAPVADPQKTARVLVLCRQHGDEPASTEAMLGLIHRLARGGDPSLRAALARVTLYIVPMVNPDGAQAGTRANGVGADLNRDWGVFHQPETRAIARAVHLLHPDLVVDAHNWDGSDEYNADCLEVPRASATALEQASHTLQRQAVQDLAADGYAVHPTAWGAEADPRLAHRWLARQGIPSVLVETHSGSPADTADFERRQGMYVALIHGLLRRGAAWAAAQPESPPPGAIQEAALFPPVGVPAAHSRPPRHHRSLAWLWALGVYGLALWGGGQSLGSGRRNLTPALSLRKGRGKNKKERLIRVASCPPDEVPPRLPFGYPSCSRKRDGTEVSVRSGQRNAVSRPPR